MPTAVADAMSRQEAPARQGRLKTEGAVSAILMAGSLEEHPKEPGFEESFALGKKKR